MTYPPRNIERIRAILEHIEAHPKTWNQGDWHCGTTHCFAGHAQIAAGKKPDSITTRSDAREWLGLTCAEAAHYFDAGRTLSELRELLEPLDSNSYDRNGYNREGFDRDGFDRDGYDREGYDRFGFDRGLYDRDRNGLDRDGFGRDGYHRDGYDWDGFDRNGNRR